MDKIKSASTTLSSSLPALPSLPPPSQYLNLYSSFILSNSTSVSSIESALRSLTYLLPGRYSESELLSESLHSSIQLLSLYHDTLLARALARLPPQLRPNPTPHTRYTKYWTTHSPSYKRLAQLLQVTQYTELLIEMGAKRRSGERGRWRAVVLLEMVKAVCRLLLLRITQRRPLVEPPLPEREDVDPALLEKAASDIPDLENYPVPSSSHYDNDKDGAVVEEEPEYTKPYAMPLTSLLLPPLPRTPTPASLTNYLLTHVLTPTDILPPPSLLSKLSSFPAQSAEVLNILRPVIYAIALAHYTRKDRQNGKRNWRPWLIGIGLELVARQLAGREREGDGAWGRGLAVTDLEREEVRRRGMGLGWWAVRGAFYENVTRGWVEGVTGKLKGKFAVDLLGGILEDYGHLWGDFYFSTATM